MNAAPVVDTVACWGCGASLLVHPGPLWGRCHYCWLCTGAEGGRYALACLVAYGPAVRLVAVPVRA
jgi:hypothetical protein